MESPFQCVLDIRASLGESPIWSAADEALYWVDINQPSLNRFDPAGGRNTSWPMPASIGCCAMRRAGGFVVALRDGIWAVDRNGRVTDRIVDAPYDRATHRFNDGRVDPQGRFFVGTINERHDGPSAKLYRLDPNGTLTTALEHMTISNGLAWSPDGRTMYHSDTPTRTVEAYDYDASTGTPHGKRVLARFQGEGERPDGGATDAEGAYWSAFYRGGKVVRIAPEGRVLAEYPVPAMCPTMCCFGGRDLRTLFVTSARQQREPAELERLPHTGGIFAMQVEVPGLPEAQFAG
jgi:sugar lactone lactonase YvrE